MQMAYILWAVWASKSAVWSFPGFTISMVVYDWMHAVDLGVTCTIEANCLWEMFVELGGTYSNPRSALSRLLSCIHAAAKCLGQKPPIHNLTITMIKATAGQAPKLRVKAAEARYLLAPIRHALLHWFDMATEHAKARYHVVDRLHQCYMEMDNWVGRESSERLSRLGRECVLIYASLNIEAQRRDRRGIYWRMYPTFHALFAPLL